MAGCLVLCKPAQAWCIKLVALLQVQQVQQEENLAMQTAKKNEGYKINCCHHQIERGRQRPDYKSGNAASLRRRAADLNKPGTWRLTPRGPWSADGLHKIPSSARRPHCMLCSHLKALHQCSEVNSGDTAALTQTAVCCIGAARFGK